MPAPPFDLRRFQEPQLQLHFPQEFFKPLYKMKDNLESGCDDVAFPSYFFLFYMWGNLHCRINPPEIVYHLYY